MQAPGPAASWFRMAVLMWLLPFASLSSFTQGSAGGDGRRMQAQDRNPGGLGGAERVGVFLRGASTNARTSKVLADLAAIKKPNSVFLPTRVEGGQMQGHAFVEKTCGKMRASMYGFVSHTKKRPDHLVLGRLFTGQVLDSFEFRVLAEGPPLTSTRRLPQLGSMTAFVFLGKFWQSDRYLTQLKNYLIDCFGIRHQQKNLLMDRIETVLVCAAHNETHITLKQYLISSPDDVTAKGHQGEMTLNASLPDLALELVAAKLADADLMRTALGLGGDAKTPQSLKRLQRKRERQMLVQEKRAAAIASHADEKGRTAGGATATAALMQHRASVDALDKKLFHVGVAKAAGKKGVK